MKKHYFRTKYLENWYVFKLIYDNNTVEDEVFHKFK